ncbi:hypothetical protein SteCoe_9327 [Stentor coeruleus]|uniref:Uncharacterized protein n=1 Tax=Stentor coeruleus TaxID=5963 RepID=A0A1R2CI80_9CILI|nr:hypothetical protein SteCoe_9327 [Stentor coeruleus]
MSINSLSKSISFSNSPAVRRTKKLPIALISQIVPEDLHEDIKSTQMFPKALPFKEPIKKLPSAMNKVIKLASRQKLLNRTSFNNSLKDLHLNSSLNDFDSIQNTGIEHCLIEKLKKEKDFSRKFEILLSTTEKLSSFDRNFFIFYKVASEFFLEFREKVLLKDENLLKIDELEKANKELRINLERSLQEVCKLNKQIDYFKVGIEKIKEENSTLRFRVKKQSLLLTKLQKEGYPLEEMYESMNIENKKSKSMNKVAVKNQEEIQRPNSIPNKPAINIPKLHFQENEGKECYQEEFMAKFNEFSESWREEIIKNHHLINK